MSATKTPTLQDVVSDDLTYERWAPIVKTRLMEERVWDVVNYGIPPDPSKIPELASKIKPKDASEWREIVENDIKALQILRSSLPDSVFKETVETTSSKDLWDLLKEANEEAKLEKKKKNDALPEYQMLAVDIAPVTFDEDMWMIHTTTTNHMTPYVKYFTTLDRTYRARVRYMSGDTTMAEGIGDVKIVTKEGTRRFTNVLFVPALDRNVISVVQTVDRGFEFLFGASKCTIKDPSGRLFAESLMEQQRGYYLRNICPRS